MAGELNANGPARRRRNKKKSRSSGPGSSESSTVAVSTSSRSDSKERKKTAATAPPAVTHKNPLFVITAVILMPYALYNAYLYLFLQHPELISFLYPTIRPAVKVHDSRQLLIVGTISSGTSQVAQDLKNNLGLEIGHENAETSWSFVRDGTVSWFHGIRYIPRPGMDVNAKTNNSGGENILFLSQVKDLCRELQPQMGFHPFMFRDGKCSLRQSWGDCWRGECEDIVQEEWGCGLRSRNDKRDDNKLHQRRDDCETPFNKVLHQVRHPLRTIESLVAKFCIGGVEGKVQPSFLIFANALFPQHNFSEMSCIEAAGYYVDEYNSAIVGAREVGIDDQFQVEEATPCQIAKAAGFMDSDSVYSPSRDRVLKVCNSESSNSAANQLMKSTENRYNKGLVSLHWEDLLGGKNGSRKKAGDDDLQKRIKRLTRNLGYDAT
ncbi:hypothetical protein QTG54_008960 [Skeletonema marinoi]|uniref:Uncharacterized protein n=1 Tax=Skeletonema marinoi TaxID=267567 RepID=A0AAD9DBW1_9STRA|nr:hypothetical protein QTG54_008960 [Skeletonema marinoi]